MNLNELVADAIQTYHAAGALTLDAYPTALSAGEIAALIDHTLLKPDATIAPFQQLCDEARTYGFASVCVHASRAALCVELLTGAATKVCTVVGFPQGATLPEVKAFEAQQAMHLGVSEVDMVLNVGRLKDGDYAFVQRDVAGVADMVHGGGGLLKVIIETALLDENEKIAACILCKEAGADFVKTSTGFNGGGATVEDIALMRRVVGAQMGVKASGGVRSAADALAMIGAGATRIGTSGGLRIVQEMAAHSPVTPPVPGDAY
jgi:deoxyribose-phosphate aldolase